MHHSFHSGDSGALPAGQSRVPRAHLGMGSVAILEEIYRPMIHRDPKDAIGALHAHIEVIYSTYGWERWISNDARSEIAYCYRMIDEARARAARLTNEARVREVLIRDNSAASGKIWIVVHEVRALLPLRVRPQWDVPRYLKKDGSSTRLAA